MMCCRSFLKIEITASTKLLKKTFTHFPTLPSTSLLSSSFNLCQPSLFSNLHPERHWHANAQFDLLGWFLPSHSSQGRRFDCIYKLLTKLRLSNLQNDLWNAMGNSFVMIKFKKYMNPCHKIDHLLVHVNSTGSAEKFQQTSYISQSYTHFAFPMIRRIKVPSNIKKKKTR